VQGRSGGSSELSQGGGVHGELMRGYGRVSLHFNCNMEMNIGRPKRDNRSIQDAPPFLLCSDCGNSKHQSDFYLKSSGRPGNKYFDKRCKACHYKLTRENRKGNEDVMKEYMRNYMREYRKNNKA
jgi:hypothetical protein